MINQELAPQESNDQAGDPFPPLGIWISLFANAMAICGAAIFLLVPGGRVRGMEPETVFFISCLLLSTLLGLFVALPISVFDLFRRKRLYGRLGMLLALTPWPVAMFISGTIGYLLGIDFDS